MRVISGSCRGRKLIPITGRQIRPTSDRVKEAIFNILGPDIVGSRILDLFSGTGALGIEALSRGADQATFMDICTDTIQANLEKCMLKQNAVVITTDLLNPNSFNYITDSFFDIIFVDPPYDKGLIEQVIEQDTFMKLINKNSIIVAEHGYREKLDIQNPALDIYRQKKYSKTMISFIKKT